MAPRKTNQETTQEPTTEETIVFPTDFYRGAGIPFCDVCGEQLRTDTEGKPICPIKKDDCERNTAS